MMIKPIHEQSKSYNIMQDTKAFSIYPEQHFALVFFYVNVHGPSKLTCSLLTGHVTSDKNPRHSPA